MKVFVIARDETGLRSVHAFPEHEDAEVERAELEAAVADQDVDRVIGSDMRDVVISHPSLFEEAA